MTQLFWRIKILTTESTRAAEPINHKWVFLEELRIGPPMRGALPRTDHPPTGTISRTAANVSVRISCYRYINNNCLQQYNINNYYRAFSEAKKTFACVFQNLIVARSADVATRGCPSVFQASRARHDLLLTAAF